MLQLDFGPGHQVWQYLERGVQIVLGVAAISLVTFLGEVWGNDDVPYEAIFVGLWWFGYGFMIALLPTPLCWAAVPFLGRPDKAHAARRRLLQGWAALSLIVPLAVSLWMFIYAAESVIYRLAISQGVDYEQIDLLRGDDAGDDR